MLENSLQYQYSVSIPTIQIIFRGWPLTFPKGKRLWSYLGIMTIIGTAGGLFASFGPPKLYATSESPEFCAACHVMEAEYDAWRHQGAHRRIKCIDCHLPNDQIVNHLIEKSLQGMWDTFIFYSGRVPDKIRLSDSGAKIAKANKSREIFYNSL